MTLKTTDAEVEAALRENGGLISQAAHKLGLSRQALHQRINISDHFKAVLREIEEQHLDVAEGNVMTSMRLEQESAKTGDVPITSKWYLERKGKNRGYGGKVEASIDEAQLLAFVEALGGDAEKLRDALGAVGVSTPEGEGEAGS